MKSPRKKVELQTFVVVGSVLALIGVVVIGLSSLRRDPAQNASPSPNIDGVSSDRDVPSRAQPLAATAEQLTARRLLLELCRERLNRTQELGRHLEAPVLKIAPIEKWNLATSEGRQLFENGQSAVAAYVHALISDTDALKSAALRASSKTTYGRKVLEARRLQREIEKLDLQIFNERKRSNLQPDALRD